MSFFANLPYVISKIVSFSTNTYFESENQLSLLSNLSQGIVLGWEQSLQKMKVVWWCGKLCCWICEWTTNMPCGGGRNNIDAWKNMNIKIEIFIISLFETKSRFVSSISRALKRDQEFVLSNLEFWEGDMKKKGISCGRARILVAKSHEIFRDREISSCSVLNKKIDSCANQQISKSQIQLHLSLVFSL